MFCDNRGAIENARHPCYSNKLRHVENKIFFIREIVERGLALLEWIDGNLNPSDLGTKAVGARLHKIYGCFLQGCPLFDADGKISRNARRRIAGIVRNADYEKKIASRARG